MFSDYLISEHRSKYKKLPAEKEKNCRFCDVFKSKKYIYVSKKHFIMINEYPYNAGHVMIAPHRHVIDIRDLTNEEFWDMFELLKKTMNVLQKGYNTSNFNIGLNIGTPAGSSFEHLHLQVLPRWEGDSGFLETTASTRILKETPQETIEKLKKLFSEV